MLCTLHFTLCPLHFTLYAPPFALCTVHSPHNSQSPPPTVMILSLLIHRLLEAQTICSTFGIVILALQSFTTPSSVSLLIPLQTLLFRTPMNAALRWATLHCTVPPQQSISTPYCNDPQPVGSSSTRSPNHLQHLWNCYPCFASLRNPFLSITSHPLANSLVPNPNERCSPLSFGVPPFSSVFPLLWTIFLHFLSFFFLPFSCHSSIFLHFPPVFNDFPSFSLFFPSLFPAGVNGPRGNRSLPSPLCVVVHAPKKGSIWTPSTATGLLTRRPPPRPPNTHFVRQNNFA